MLSEFEQRRQELRTQIARSRLRLDRHLHETGRDLMRMLPLSGAAATHTWANWLGLALTSMALTRWHDPPRVFAAWREQVWGTVLSDGAQQLMRHLLALARHARRRRRARETSHE
jgi:hypothetical protein